MATRSRASVSNGKAGLGSIVYQLKVVLQGITPPIWRRIQVPGDVTLERLHRILQDVMGWQDCHLWEFRIDGICYGIPHPDSGVQVRDAARTRLGEVIPPDEASFEYVYDFGDDWGHAVVVERVLPAEPSDGYPRCLGGARACPPEDCGGVWGYENLLAALRGEGDDEERAELLEWVGDEFDPEAFVQAL